MTKDLTGIDGKNDGNHGWG